MRFERTFVVLAAIVVVMVLAWTIILAFGIGTEKILKVLSGTRELSVEQFGQFGASFGFLAALFAGLAVVLLWQSIRVQQGELNELRNQMEEDRNLNVLIWMLDNYKEIRAHLRYKSEYGPERKATSIGIKVLEALHSMLLGSRLRGDCTEETTAREYGDILYEAYGRALSARTTAAQPLSVSIEEIMRFVVAQKASLRARSIRLVWAVLTPRDLFVIHELAILRDDSSLAELLAETSFFAGLDSIQKSAIQKGPRLRESAYCSKGASA